MSVWIQYFQSPSNFNLNFMPEILCHLHAPSDKMTLTWNIQPNKLAVPKSSPKISIESLRDKINEVMWAPCTWDRADASAQPDRSESSLCAQRVDFHYADQSEWMSRLIVVLVNILKFSYAVAQLIFLIKKRYRNTKKNSSFCPVLYSYFLCFVPGYRQISSLSFNKSR